MGIPDILDIPDIRAQYRAQGEYSSFANRQRGHFNFRTPKVTVASVDKRMILQRRDVSFRRNDIVSSSTSFPFSPKGGITEKRFPSSFLPKGDARFNNNDNSDKVELCLVVAEFTFEMRNVKAHNPTDDPFDPLANMGR